MAPWAAVPVVKAFSNPCTPISPSLASRIYGAAQGSIGTVLSCPSPTPIPFLGEGNTPLVPSRRIGPALGLNHLYFKHEGCNPTGAFKDRGASLVAALALEAGAKGVVTASSGNAGAAIAAYSAAVGLPCLLLLEPGAPPAKLRQALTTGAKVLSVEGVFSHGPKASGDMILEPCLSAQLLSRLYLGACEPLSPGVHEDRLLRGREPAIRFPRGRCIPCGRG